VDITTSELKTMKYQPLRVDQLEMILKSLRFDQIGARHMTIKNAHAKTCKWLLENQQYLDWLDPGKLDSHHGFLWIKGKPGTGKSTLMKYALTYLRRRMKDQKIISFYFNARGGDMEKCTTGMYRSLLLQLLEQLPELQYLLQSLPIAGTSDDYVWNIQQLKCVFEEAIHNIKDATVLCFIDALDECDEDEIRDMISFFQNVGEFTTSNNIKFLVCFSSRHYPHISKENALDLTLEGQEGHEQDIINYLNNELKIGQSRLAKQIRAEIREKAAGIFMWVFLVVEILNKEFDRGRIHELRQRLRDIPGDLHELFRDILTRDDHRKDELLLCIQWLLFSRQPLAPEEFYFAVLSGTLREGASSWDAEGISVEDMKKFILSSSKGLAEITKSKSPTVQFIHESVKDFLLKEDGLKDIYTDLGDGFVGRSHDRLKQCCLQYLNDNFVDLENCISLPTASSKQADHLRRFTKKEFPFIYYVVQNILHHANAAEMDQDKQTIFFQTLPFVTWVTLSNLFEKFEIRRYTPKVTLIYVLAKYNAANLIRYHPSKLLCFEIGKERYGPPMFAALATNSNEAVEVFLEAHIQALSEEKSDSSLLCQLYEQYRLDKNKRQRIRQDFNFSSRRGILSHLAEHDDVTITYFWLNWAKTGVNFNSQDVVGKTPLFWAAEKGSNNMLNLLLRHGADVNIKSEFDGSPLIKAVDSRHETTVKLFLEAGADVDAKDRFDESPLHKAASYGHGAIAKLLLEAGADAMAKSNGGALPLHKSMRGVAIYGSEESYSVVTQLLRKSAAEVNARDSCGDTPLMYAAEYPTKSALNDTLKHIWRAAAVKLLLENGADANAKNRRGETPLYLAASRSDEKLVKLLLENGADVKSKDCSGRTALHVAAGLYYGGETVKLLLESGADIEAKEECGETPLHIAAESSYKEIVKLLLESGAKINAQTRTGETPLHKAAARGGAELVELLVAHNASLRSNNKSGQIPLEIAQRRLATSSASRLSSIQIEDMMRAIQLLETATKSEDVVISLL
jgi:ankyrin repeat protein